MPRNLSIAILCLAASGCIGAAAQTIYRCGDSYSQQPCVGGSQVQAADPRSAGQRSQAGAGARGDAKTVDAMEKARLKEEAKPAQAYIPPGKPTAAVEEDSRAAQAEKARKPAVFTATSPGKTAPKAAKKKATKAKTAKKKAA
jgi:hypothetical protein